MRTSGLEIRWDELPTEVRPCTVWLQGIPCTEQTRLAALLGELFSAAGWRSLPIFFRPDGFQSYSGFAVIIRALVSDCPEVGQVVIRYKGILRELCPAIVPRDKHSAPPPPTATGEFIAAGVTRRINRETYRLCHLIDQAACFLLDALEAFAGPQGQAGLLVTNYDWVDRPSLKILARAQVLARRGAIVHIVGMGETLFSMPDESAGSGIRERLHQARADLFQRLQTLLRPAVLRWTGSRAQRPKSRSLHLDAKHASAMAERTVASVAQEVARLNFDRALLEVDALERSSDQDNRVHHHRLLGIIEAQLGHYDGAFRAVTDAVAFSSDPHLRAHLHYLLGLLLTKRLYDFDQAEVYYRRGLACLEGTDAAGVETKLERAWLHNGLCLLDLLRAKLLPTEEQPTRLLELLRQQMNISDSLRGTVSPGALYLRYNLFANIATLLSLLGQGERAMRCWRETFEHHFGRNGSHPEFDRRIRYHIGMLLHRAGWGKESIGQLHESLAAAKREHTRLEQERIHLALGTVYYRLREYEPARDHFGDGAQLAFRLRNWTALAEHAAGALWAAAELAAEDDFWAIVGETSRLPLPDSETRRKLRGLAERRRTHATGARLTTLLREATLDLPEPPTALSASIGSIDLEAMPAVSAANLIAARAIERVTLPA